MAVRLLQDDQLITDREVAIKANPYLVSQNNRGNCGTAATLMAMLDNLAKPKIKAKYDALKETAFNGTKFGEIGESIKIKNRIDKRYTADYANDLVANLDYDLCTAMVILVKEALKQDSKTEEWNKNLAYATLLCANPQDMSQAWHSNPVKAKDVNPLKTLGPNTKRGDIALTSHSLQVLLKLMGFAVEEEVFAQNLAHVKTCYQPGGNWSKSNSVELETMVENNNTLVGALAGVSRPPNGQKPGVSWFDHINHWVYLPKSTFTGNIKPAYVWNWGEAYDAERLFTEDEFNIVKVLKLKIE